MLSKLRAMFKPKSEQGTTEDMASAAMTNEEHALTQIPEDIPTMQEFMAHQAVRDFYKQSLAQGRQNEAIQFLSTLLTHKPLPQAAMFALLCGSLVENGADPELAFLPCCNVMLALLKQLEPYCAQREDEEDSDDPTAIERWNSTEAHLNALTDKERQYLDLLRQAVDTAVLPIMAMLMRSLNNHQQFTRNRELLTLIYHCDKSDTLEFEDLNYLVSASHLTYDEVIVILPASHTGILVEAYAINNTFHAFTLLQPLLAAHAKVLQLGKINPDVLQTEQIEEARYHWLSALAYEHGELRNEMAMAWGESYLYQQPRHHGRLVLIALEKKEYMHRGWSRFCDVLHDAQHPAITFKRYLTQEEVAQYLD